MFHIFSKKRTKRWSAKKIQKRRFLDFTLTPSQNFLAENFTLPQGEGDYTEFEKKEPGTFFISDFLLN
jgi:hypothetical protein